MKIEPVITQYFMDEDLEKSTYRVSKNGSEYLFMVEETELYTVDYRENFSDHELDPRYFCENMPETFDLTRDIEKIFSDLIERNKREEVHEIEVYSLSESTM